MSQTILKAFICGVVIMAAPFFMSGAAKSAEIIQSFNVTADVHLDGSVDIREEITVNAERNKIRHGIYRDIPTEYTDKDGRPFHMPLMLGKVVKDGKYEPYRVELLDNGRRIYIGDKGNTVARGQHTYSIQYKVARVIGFFPHGDEFYWNVTGNGWDFPIAKASITVNFPDGVKVIRTAGYTGPQGSTLARYKGQAFGNHFTASTTMGLGVREGFTIVASVPSGTIQRETTWQQIKYFFIENSMWLVWMSFAFMSLTYLFLSWVKHGRDVMGVVVPRFDAPEDVDPDLLRYIFRQKYDMKTFTTLIVNAASHGKIEIDESENFTSFTLTKAAKHNDNKIFHMDILRAAFLGKETIVLPKKGLFAPKVTPEIGQALWNARLHHETQIEADSEPYLDKNRNYVAYGCIIGILGAIWAVFLGISDDQKFFLMLGSVVFYAMIFELFAKIMPQYTVHGQDVVDHAAGLKMYMKTAEKERMNKLYPKDITPETFEKLLPYAIALDVEQEWCDYIDTLVREGAIPEQSMSNFRSRRDYGSHYGSINSSISSLSSVISSSTTAPGSSSGFGGGGGGGSSGGGGGGGGGGGW